MDPAGTAPALGESEHDKAMIAKFEASQPPAPPKPQAPAPAPAARPDNVPEKFWDSAKGAVNTEALLKSYAELERLRGAPSGSPSAPPPPPPTAPAPPADPNAPPPPPAAPAPPAAPGKLDLPKLVAEVEAGGLSEESVKALEAVGFTKDIAEQMVRGQMALAEQQDAQALAKAGMTKDQFDAMAVWAETGLQPAEQDAFNKAMRGSVEQRALFLTGLKAKYEAANGKPPALLSGNSDPPPGSEGAFKSRAEVVQAMSDPRYSKDPAYRAEVERRIAMMPTF